MRTNISNHLPLAIDLTLTSPEAVGKILWEVLRDTRDSGLYLILISVQTNCEKMLKTLIKSNDLHAWSPSSNPCIVSEFQSRPIGFN